MMFKLRGSIRVSSVVTVEAKTRAAADQAVTSYVLRESQEIGWSDVQITDQAEEEAIARFGFGSMYEYPPAAHLVVQDETGAVFTVEDAP